MEDGRRGGPGPPALRHVTEEQRLVDGHVQTPAQQMEGETARVTTKNPYIVQYKIALVCNIYLLTLFI